MEQRRQQHNACPKSVSEAVDWLEAIIPAGELDLIAVMAEDDLVGLHVELGAYIRDRLGLWSGNEALKVDAGVQPAVEVSMVIVTALWQRLHHPVPFRISA